MAQMRVMWSPVTSKAKAKTVTVMPHPLAEAAEAYRAKAAGGIPGRIVLQP
jgi:hypothetical protein